MHITARRVFRLSSTTALALACGYALQMPLPYLAPLFALMLTAQPGPPMGPKGLLGLIVIVLITMGVGVVLTPLLAHYPFAAILIAALGLYFSAYLTLNKGKALLGLLLAVGITMISAAGTVSSALSLAVIQALAFSIAIAIVCHWLVYPWFPEDATSAEKETPAPVDTEQANWVALRSTLIVLPAYLLLLTNPAMYMPIIVKSVSLAQQGSVMEARLAARELVGSTFLAGCFAILFWFALKLHPSLWMFFLWMLLFGLYFASKLYGLLASRFSTAFWQNVAATMLLLLGPAVQDTATGKDVYAAFAVRMGLFIGVALYASLAIYVLEQLRNRRLQRRALALRKMESPGC
jgi:hypothetical protein